MRLYFFPALLPLSAFAPWVLAFVGFLAGVYHRWRRRQLAGVFSILALILAAGLLGARAWSMRGAPRLIKPEVLPLRATNGEWTQLLPRAPFSNLAYSAEAGVVVFGTRQKSLDAVSLTDGRLVFSLQMTEPVMTEPLVVNGTAYVGEGLHDATRARLTAVEIPSGRVIWYTWAAGHIEAQPRISADGDILYFCAGDSGIYAVRAKTGRLLWQERLGHCDTTPLLTDEGLFVLSGVQTESRLSFLDSSGKVVWAVAVPGEPWGTPMRAGALVLFSTGKGQLDLPGKPDEKAWVQAVDLRSHQLIWTRSFAGMPVLSQVVFEKNGREAVIQVLKKGLVLALDPATGSTLWETDLKTPVLAPPRLIPGTARILVIGFTGRAIQLDGVSGRVVSERELFSESTSSPAFSGTHILFGTRAGITGVPLAGETWP